MKVEIENLSKEVNIRVTDVFESMDQAEFVDCSPEIIIDTQIESTVLNFVDSLPVGEEVSEEDMIAIERSVKEIVMGDIDLEEIRETLEKSEYCNDVLQSLGLTEKDFL